MNRILRNVAVFAAAIGFSFAASAIPVAGTSSGKFVNPVGPSGMVTSGVGTNNFHWGVGSPNNSLVFNGASFSGNTGSPFNMGGITYYNGAINAGTQADSVDFLINLVFTNPAGVSQSFQYLINIINTPNNGVSQQADADTITFSTLPTQSFTVNGVTYTLALQVGASGPNGFTTQNSFSVFENASATASLQGTLTTVPEPASLGLLGLGLAGIGLARRRKSKSAA